MEFKGTTRTWYCDETTVKTVEIPIAYVGGENKEMSLANAKLIATAPELLEALIEAQKCIEKYINQIPTGKIRNEVCDINIKSLTAITKALTI